MKPVFTKPNLRRYIQRPVPPYRYLPFLAEGIYLGITITHLPRKRNNDWVGMWQVPAY